jgi:hypothetical protein
MIEKVFFYRLFYKVAIILALLGYGTTAWSLDYGTHESFVEVHGLISQAFTDFQKDADDEGIPGFDTRRTYLFFECMVRENLDGVIEIKLDHGGEAFKVDRCFIDWEISDLLKIKTGKFYLDAILDVKSYRPTGNKFVSSRFPSIFEPDLFRDVGISAYGDFKLNKMKIGYNTAYSNGSIMSYNENSRDTNEDKAVLGKLMIWPVNNLNLAASYFKTRTDFLFEEETPVNPLTGIVDTIIADYGEMDLELVSFFSKLKIGRLELSYLVYEGNLSKASADGILSSWVGEASLRLLDNKLVNYIDIACRALNFKMDIADLIPSDPDNEMDYNSYSAGLIVSPYKHFLLKMEYQVNEDLLDTSAAKDGFLLEAVIDF